MFLSIENVPGVPDASSFPPVCTNRSYTHTHAQRDIIDFGTSRWLKTGQRPGWPCCGHLHNWGPSTQVYKTTRWTRGAGPAVGITVSAQFSGIILWLKCSMIFSSIFFWFLEISIFPEKFQDFFSTKLFTHLQNAPRVTPRPLISWQTMFLSIENVSGVPDGSRFPLICTNRGCNL